MKDFIETRLRIYSSLYKHPAEVLEHLFCVLGNGVDLTLKGYLENNYIEDDEAFEFKEPIALDHIYPFSKNNTPLLKYKGCKNKGFKEAVAYLRNCILITDDNVKNIKEWKDNIHLFQEVIDAEEIQPKYKINEIDKFLENVKNEKRTYQKPVDSVLEIKESVYKTWYFDVQWTDCPESVEDEVSEIWRNNLLRNDTSFYQTILDEELFDDYPGIYFWLIHKGVSIEEKVIIHWWW